MSQLYQLNVTDITGQKVSLGKFAGQVWLVVNTASLCRFTAQYAELERLYQQYQAAGLVILAFPCNQFGQQEPGTAEQIAEFCDSRYQLHFPLFAPIQVNGPQAHPLFRQLKQSQPGIFGSQAIKWNFTKFLVDRQGQARSRFAPYVRPLQLEPSIVSLLEHC